MVGLIHEAQKRPADAKKKYEEALTINPRSMVANNNLAYLYAEEGENLDRALLLAQNAVAQSPDNPTVQDTLGWVYYKKDLPDLAIRAFEQSIAKDGKNALYYYHLGVAQVKKGEVSRGRQSLESALKLRPDYPDAQRALKSATS